MRSRYLGTFINYGDPHADLGTAFTVRYEENNIRDIQALIIGPPGTPYELGFYEVRSTYPRLGLSTPMEVPRYG